MLSQAPIAPLSPTEREVICQVVDPAPPLRPALVAELASIIGRAA